MFAVLEYDRNPLQWGDLAGGLVHWMQAAGGLAVVGIALWAVFRLPKLSAGERARTPAWQRNLFVGCCLGAILLDLVWGGLFLYSPAPEGRPVATLDGSPAPRPLIVRIADLVLAAGGALAVLAALVPVLGGHIYRAAAALGLAF